MFKPLLSIPEAGRYLGYAGKTCGKTSVYKLISENRLVKVKVNGRTFVPRDSLEQLIWACTVNRQVRPWGESCNIELDAPAKSEVQ